MDFNFQWLFEPTGKLAIADALGGVIRWLTLKQSPMDVVIGVIVGAICALYVGPALRPILRPVVDFAGVDPDVM